MNGLRSVIAAALLVASIGCGGPDGKDAGSTDGKGPGSAAVDPRIAESKVKIEAVSAALKSGDLAVAEAALAPLSHIKEELPVDVALKIDALEREAAQLRSTKDVKAPELPPLPPPKSE